MTTPFLRSRAQPISGLPVGDGFPAVVDGQLHELGPRSEVPVDDVAIRRRIMLETTLSTMDAVGVDAAILHPVDDGVADLAVAEFPDRFGVVRVLDPETPDIEGLVQQTRSTPGNVGIRIVASFPPPKPELTRLLEGGYDPMLAAAEHTGLPVFLFVSGDLPVIRPIAEKYPDLQLVVDHLGIKQPPLDPRDTPPFATLPELVDLARLPNVAVKLCGVPALSRTGPPFSDTWPFVHEILGAFGVDRVFWASDIPRFQGRITWDMKIENAWTAYEGEHTYADSLSFIWDTDQITDDEKRGLLGRTIRQLVAWNVRAGEGND